MISALFTVHISVFVTTLLWLCVCIARTSIIAWQLKLRKSYFEIDVYGTLSRASLSYLFFPQLSDRSLTGNISNSQSCSVALEIRILIFLSSKCREKKSEKKSHIERFCRRWRSIIMGFYQKNNILPWHSLRPSSIETTCLTFEAAIFSYSFHTTYTTGPYVQSQHLHIFIFIQLPYDTSSLHKGILSLSHHSK